MFRLVKPGLIDVVAFGDPTYFTKCACKNSNCRPIGRLKPLILLVEDNPLDLELTVLALEKSGAAHHLYVARDGEEALHFLLEGHTSDYRRPSLVLLDLKLPKVDGVEVLKQIRFTPSLSDLPVIVLSGSNEESDRHRTAALGVTHYLVKPMEWNGFDDVLRSVLVPVLPEVRTFDSQVRPSLR